MKALVWGKLIYPLTRLTTLLQALHILKRKIVYMFYFLKILGATVVSWRVNNQEQLFVSKQAQFDGKKPIRGGIPFVFRK